MFSALGGSASLRIPSIGMSDLASYIETVEDLLRNSVILFICIMAVDTPMTYDGRMTIPGEC